MLTPPFGTAGAARLVTTPKDLSALVARLAEADRLGIDTEGASFHRYVDRIYLLQVSSEQETAIVDPLAISDLSSFGRLLSDPAIELVFHDADYDLRTLDRDYGFRATNVFDTRIAAQLLGEPEIGLGALLAKFYGVRLNKKFQRADWSRRPLSDEMISYAAADTRYLPALRDELAGQLASRGREGWADEEFGRLQSVRWGGADSQGEGFLKLKGAKALGPRALAVLRALYQWREAQAKESNSAPFRILPNEALVKLAASAPVDPAALAAVEKFPRSLARRYGTELLRVVRGALGSPEDQWPRIDRPRRPKPDPEVDARLERLKRMRNAAAAELGLQPGVLCPNGTLQAVARVGPENSEQLDEITDLRRWQRTALGEARIFETVQRLEQAD